MYRFVSNKEKSMKNIYSWAILNKIRNVEPEMSQERLYILISSPTIHVEVEIHTMSGAALGRVNR